MTQPDKVWTVKEALDWTRGYLEGKGDANALISARQLLSHATGLTHLELYTMFDRPLSMDERCILRDGVARRAQGEPLQYITGHAPFRYLDVIVRPGVLIPRPETEVLVDEVIRTLEGEEAPRIADIGCGSGCIACSLATEVPHAKVWATDISPDACALACENVAALEVADSVTVIQCDLDAGIPEELHGSFDALVSNPPYIPDAVMRELPAEVKDYEPEFALAGGADGLDVFRRLLGSARRLLRPGGFFAVELHEGSLEEAKAMAVAQGFEGTSIVNDLAGKPRILTARL